MAERVVYLVDCRNCRYFKDCGAARISAETFASAHYVRHPHHTVDLWEARTLRTFTATEPAKQLDEPPF